MSWFADNLAIICLALMSTVEFFILCASFSANFSVSHVILPEMCLPVHNYQRYRYYRALPSWK